MSLTYYTPRSKARNLTKSAAVDIIENADNYIVIANVPGFTKEEIEITADHESLSFSAKKAETENEEKPKYIHRERFTSTLSRTMTFAKPIEAAKSTVTLKDGVLNITLPLAENARAVKLTPQENWGDDQNEYIWRDIYTQ